MANQKPRPALLHLYLGTQLAVTVLVCFFIGYFLDRKLGWSPVLTIAGGVLGAALGIYNLIRQGMSGDADK